MRPPMAPCPSCGSEKTRRGGAIIWVVYLILIALALPAVLVFDLPAGLVAGVMLSAVVLAHLIVAQRVCEDCGAQWRG